MSPVEKEAENLLKVAISLKKINEEGSFIQMNTHIERSKLISHLFFTSFFLPCCNSLAGPRKIYLEIGNQQLYFAQTEETVDSIYGKSRA